MKISLACPVTDATYIRHARTETLKMVGVIPTPAGVEPLPTANYLFAYDDQTQQIMGMTETAMLGGIYSCYEDSPNSAISDLNQWCPIQQMASMRTVFVEPEFRGRSLVYFGLTLASAQLFLSLGARYGTATTNAANEYLCGLYLKCGGELAGRAFIDGTEVALFVFDLHRAVEHRAMARLQGSFAFPHNVELAGAQVRFRRQ